MKRPEDDWQRQPDFDEGPEPFDEGSENAEDPREFNAIRRIELLGRMHHMAFTSLLRSDGLPPAQAGAMKVIIRYPGLSQRELADKLHIQRATTTVMLQKMEKAGYIQRCSDQGDQRISRIYPTEAALTLDEETRKNVDAYFARCFSGVSPEAFEVMYSAMQQVAQNLRDILDNPPKPRDKE